MSDEPKYRQRGYQDSGRSSEPRSRDSQAPPPKKEEPQPSPGGARAAFDALFKI